MKDKRVQVAVLILHKQQEQINQLIRLAFKTKSNPVKRQHVLV